MPKLEFLGKGDVAGHHLTVPYRELMPDEGRSVGKVDMDGNLIIHGDNLLALKALLPNYAGRIGCIYIDPPYNTGNEGWIYNDRINSPLINDWHRKVVDRDDQCRHDKWLCMMWPRLSLLRELLTDDGVILVSIDDNEQHHLRDIMDEIFGEENYRNLLIIRRGIKSVQDQFKHIDRLNYGAEYVLVYTKNSDVRFRQFRVRRREDRSGMWNNHWRGTDRPTMRYPLFGITPETGQWRWGKERSAAAAENYTKMIKAIDKKNREITQDEIDAWWLEKLENEEKFDLLRLSTTGKPEHYVPPSSDIIPSSLWSDLKPNGGHQFHAIMGEVSFDNPKSIDLINRLISFSCHDKNTIVLDSFAGSGTTAHAVLALNREDGGNRKFILVECEDYADTITAERVRRVIKGVPDARQQSLKAGLGGFFTYATLGDEIGAEGLLSGDAMPSWERLARYLFWLATGKTLEKEPKPNSEGYVGTARGDHVYLLYQPDIAFMQGDGAILTGSMADALGAKHVSEGRVIVYAAGAYISEKDMQRLRILFCQLPWAITKKHVGG